MPIVADYGTLQRAIADELGDNVDLLDELSDTGLASSPIKRAIQSAIAKWERQPFYFNEEYNSPPADVNLFSTVVGQELYTSATIASTSTFWRLHVLIGNNRYTMVRRSWDYLENMAPNPSLRGQPAEWAYFAESIRLYPIPDGVYQVRGSRTARLDPLVNDADSNVWTTDAYDLIRSEAKLILARDVLHDPQIKAECEEAIYGTAARPDDKGYLGALRAETVRRARSSIKATQF